MAQPLSLAFEILARDRASQNLDHVADSLGRAARAGSFFGTVAGAGVAKGMGLLGDAAKAAIGQIGSTISAASDLNESLSKTRTVFGASSASVEAFAQTAAVQLGISKQAALESASTFGNLFTALKIAPAASATLSTSLVKLAADLGSFNNVDSAEVLESLRSGLLGEAEPLRKFGVSLSQARIQAVALAEGIVKPVGNVTKLHQAQATLSIATTKAGQALVKNGKDSTQFASAQLAVEKAAQAVATSVKGQVPELTAAQKATAAYKIILQDTKTAQGDFGRTSGGLANQQKILASQFSDLKSQIGTALLPKVIELTRYVNSDVVPAIMGFVQGMQDGTGSGGKFADTLGSLATFAKDAFDTVKPLVSFVADHPDAFAAIAVGAASLAAAFKVMSAYTKLKALLFGIAAGEAAVGAEGAAATPKVGGLISKLGKLAPLAGPVGIALGLEQGLQYLNNNVINPDGPRSADELFARAVAQASATPSSPQSSLTDQRKRQLQNDLNSDDPKVAARARAALAAAKAAAASLNTATDQVKTSSAGANNAISTAAATAAAAAKQAGIDAATALRDSAKANFDQAKQILDDVLAKAKALRDQIGQSLIQGSQITDVFGSGTNLNGNHAFGSGADFDKVKRFFERRLSQLRHFAAELKTLLKQGLDPEIVAQIANAGLEQGGRLADALSGAGTAKLGQINSLNKQIAGTALGTGQAVADRQFTAQINSARANAAFLGRKVDTTNAILTRLEGKTLRTTATTQRVAAAMGGA